MAAVFSENHTAVVAISIHDCIYLHDFSVKHLELDHSKEEQEVLSDYIMSELQAYEKKNFCKFIGAGLPHELLKKAPSLCPRLWAELDTVPIAMHPDKEGHSVHVKNHEFWDHKCVDEQADSMARKCIMYVSYSSIATSSNKPHKGTLVQACRHSSKLASGESLRLIQVSIQICAQSRTTSFRLKIRHGVQ
jgi:hypothetical protein